MYSNRIPLRRGFSHVHVNEKPKIQTRNRIHNSFTHVHSFNIRSCRWRGQQHLSDFIAVRQNTWLDSQLVQSSYATVAEPTAACFRTNGWECKIVGAPGVVSMTLAGPLAKCTSEILGLSGRDDALYSAHSVIRY